MVSVLNADTDPGRTGGKERHPQCGAGLPGGEVEATRSVAASGASNGGARRRTAQRSRERIERDDL